MKLSALLIAACLALSPAAFAKSPSSDNVDAQNFDFTARDNGLHTGWCTAPGHPESQGQGQANASGHRNHDHCEEVCDPLLEDCYYGP
jgi:hypothetical protein